MEKSENETKNTKKTERPGYLWDAEMIKLAKKAASVFERIEQYESSVSKK